MKVGGVTHPLPAPLPHLSSEGKVNRVVPMDSPCLMVPLGFFPGCVQTLVIEDSQARVPCGRVRLSKTASRIQSILHPVEKDARISSCVTRRGP